MILSKANILRRGMVPGALVHVMAAHAKLGNYIPLRQEQYITVESLGGITRDSKAFEHVERNILGQRYLHNADRDSTFAFETNPEPDQFDPVHIHPTQG